MATSSIQWYSHWFDQPGLASTYCLKLFMGTGLARYLLLSVLPADSMSLLLLVLRHVFEIVADCVVAF
jgi:hypothetical protein